MSLNNVYHYQGENIKQEFEEICSSESGDDDDWEGIDEESLTLERTTCLFCTEIFDKVELAFEHCRMQHLFDIVSFSRKLCFNCISYIKFVNYVRMHKISAPQLIDICKENCPWISDEYMKPYNPTDPLLTFDIESFVQEKWEERKDNEEMVTLPQIQFESIMQKLISKDMKLKNAYDRIEKMKETAKQVILYNNYDVNQNPSSSENISDDSDGYFSTYDHFAIHHEMLQDKIRTLAYKEAIINNKDIFHNKKVLDVGCGTSILSMFAATAGARKVLAVDNSDIIYQAMDIVRENSLENVIDLFKGKVEEVPVSKEKFDIIVSEWMGYFLLFEGMLDSVIYARDKFLSPNGYMFPNRCALYIVAVSDVDKYNEYVNFWDDVYGYKMSGMKRDVIKEANVETIKSEVVCSNHAIVKELDITTCTLKDLEFFEKFELKMLRSCCVTALVGYFECWFDKGLSHKVILSTSPASEATHWKQTLFLFPKPIDVSEGETIKCQIYCRKNRRDPRSLIVKLSFGGCQNDYHLS